MRKLPLAGIMLAAVLAIGASAPVAGSTLLTGMPPASSPSKVSLVASKKTVKPCTNRLAVVLYEAGFRKRNHREAWAIAMRESRGRKNAVSHTNDYGIFQFNKATWGDAIWWDEKRLLKRPYNARVAYHMSRGGKTWYPWGLTGKGQPNAQVYRASGWGKKKVKSYILAPYERFYQEYRDLPRECRWKGLHTNARGG